MENKTVINGEYTDAIVYLPEDEIEEEAYEQVQEMVNHPAFTNPVRIMPDMHWGAGAVIGFTMPVTNRVSPNTVGVDIGCGMFSAQITDVDYDVTEETDLTDIDSKVRTNVPMGTGVLHGRNDYHMRDDFPWEEVNEKWETFALEHLDGNIELGDYHPNEFTYDIEYLQNVAGKVGYNFTDIINSVGTLGAGNHFIELALDSDENIWCTCHSGSRGIGYKIADYHQNRAEEIRQKDAVRTALTNLPEKYKQYINTEISELTNSDLHKWIHNKQLVNYEKLKNDYVNTEEAYKIEEISNVINGLSREHFDEYGEYVQGINTDELERISGSNELAFLQDEEAVEYFVDMAFAQTYASVNRKEMVRTVSSVLDGEIVDSIESVHNYIDYEDGILRKGATPSRDDERGVIPMNMAFGSLLVRGKGNREWNYSSPHGAGRRMSRTQAKDELDFDSFEDSLGDTVATKLPLDESPMAYKDVKLIQEAMEPTAEIVDRLEPVLSMKAE